MQLGIIGAILAVIIAGSVFLFGGTANEVTDKEVMEKRAMEEKFMSEGAIVKSDEDADEIEKSMMNKDRSIETGDSMTSNSGSKMQTEENIVKDDAMQKDGAMMEKDAMTKGSIQDYSPEKLALAGKGKVLLFFHAAWCPICRGLDAEAAANANIVPDGLTVLKVDFDTATALRQKYGVTVQHTFVQVDASGNSLAKFSDASTYSAVFGKVQ
jgi:thioredoxin 1